MHTNIYLFIFVSVQPHSSKVYLNSKSLFWDQFDQRKQTTLPVCNFIFTFFLIILRKNNKHEDPPQDF